MAKYEILYPVRKDGELHKEGLIELSGDDARIALERGTVRPLLGGDGGDGGPTTDPGDAGDNTPKSELAEALGDDIAATLEAAGYTTAEQVRSAGEEELGAINGIGPKSLEKIRAELG